MAPFDTGKFIMEDAQADRAIALLTHRLVSDLLAKLVESGVWTHEETSALIAFSANQVVSTRPDLEDAVHFFAGLITSRMPPAP